MSQSPRTVTKRTRRSTKRGMSMWGKSLERQTGRREAEMARSGELSHLEPGGEGPRVRSADGARRRRERRGSKREGEREEMKGGEKGGRDGGQKVGEVEKLVYFSKSNIFPGTSITCSTTFTNQWK